MNWERNFTKWIGSRMSVVVHSIFFMLMFVLPFFGFNLDSVLLILTTVVSLEAIYLSIFIQMTVNENTQSLEDAKEDIEEIVEEVSEISEDVDEIQQDVDEIQHDVDEIQQDVDEIQEDVDEIQEDVDEIEKDTGSVEGDSKSDRARLENIENVLKKLLEEIEHLKKK